MAAMSRGKSSRGQENYRYFSQVNRNGKVVERHTTENRRWCEQSNGYTQLTDTHQHKQSNDSDASAGFCLFYSSQLWLARFGLIRFLHFGGGGGNGSGSSSLSACEWDGPCECRCGMWAAVPPARSGAATVYWSASVRPVPESVTFKILCWSNDTNRSAGAQSLEDGVCPHIVGWQLLLAAVTPSQLLPLLA